jgi:type 1 glutamine amidotransferase
MADPVNVYLIAGGKYHDIDFARLELLKLLAEHERIRVKIGANYADQQAIAAADMLITYTCDVQPVGDQINAVKEFLGAGRRWFALHGTNSVLQFLENGLVDTPDTAPEFMEILGSQFAAHPPIGRYEVKVCDHDHAMTREIEDFWVEDELYLADCAPGNHVLMQCSFAGKATGFVREDWEQADHPVLYHRPHSGGEVMYLTLGHCRGKYDLRELMPVYPYMERCSWNSPTYYELLRRGIRWAARL